MIECSFIILSGRNQKLNPPKNFQTDEKIGAIPLAQVSGEKIPLSGGRRGLCRFVSLSSQRHSAAPLQLFLFFTGLLKVTNPQAGKFPGK
jgi:hypothetical protein